MTPIEVKEIVQSGLRQRSDEGKTIQVVGLPVLIDGQWQVLVEPTEAEPSPRYRYYDMLGEVEDWVSDERGLSVFLTPAPEATYRYKTDNGTIEVKKRETMLFVSTAPWQGFWAIYDPEGGHMGEIIVGEEADRQRLPSGWKERFDRAVHLYIEERKHREERARLLAASGL